MEGSPGGVQQVWGQKLDIPASRLILGVSGLHPQNSFGHASFDSRGQAATASADTRKSSRVHADKIQGTENHGGE